MVSDEKLNEIFTNVGKEYGFDKINAEFMAFKEFKVRWQRSYKWADFKVSDYLSDAPEVVITGLCNSLFSKIVGKEEVEYSDEMCSWVTSEDFVANKQPVYVKRGRNTTKSHVGAFKDLNDSYDRLVNMKLVERDPQMFLSWTKDTTSRKTGASSVLMKVININTQLDSDLIPDYVLDFCLYHELCHMIVGFDPLGKGHGIEFLVLEDKFTKHEEANEWLNKLGMHV